MNRPVDVLIHVEDPGAANMVLDLVPALRGLGLTAAIIADGWGRTYLTGKCVTFRTEDGCSAQKLLDSFRPRVIVVGSCDNPNSRSLALTESAHSNGIPSCGLIDTPANSDARFRGSGVSPLQFAPDWLAVADDRSLQAYAALGFQRDHIKVIGLPHFDRVRERRDELSLLDRAELRRRLLPNADPAQPVLVFLAEGRDRLNPQASYRSDDYTIKGRGGSDFRTVIVLEEILDACSVLVPRPYIVVRPHPKNEADDFVELADELDLVTTAHDPHELLWIADLVVGMTTVLLVESAILGLPTISILPRTVETAWLTALDAGAITIISNRELLLKHLPELLRGHGCIESDSSIDNLYPQGATARLAELVAWTAGLK